VAIPRNEMDLERALGFLYQQWKLLGYRPLGFYRMLVPDSRHYRGGVFAVQSTLRKSGASGFEFLRSRGKLAFSIECLVLRETWSHLFTDDDKRIALERLSENSNYPARRTTPLRSKSASGCRNAKDS